MANLAKTDLTTDVLTILDNSGSDRGFAVNVVNYCWDLFVTQAGGAPTTVHQATARTDLVTSANAEKQERWRAGSVW